jgi:hypothetical protein
MVENRQRPWVPTQRGFAGFASFGCRSQAQAGVNSEGKRPDLIVLAKPISLVTVSLGC